MPIENGQLTITPEDISLGQHLFAAFDHYETEIAASWLVNFAKERKQGWTPFTIGEIENFYRQTFPTETFNFQKLLTGGFIRAEGERLHFTEDFISRCYSASTRP
jgi:hypothetical protein